MAGVYRARGGPRVIVREGRRGRALEIDGTFASWWTPGRATTGSVWDALASALLVLPPARRRALLVLGLGGGSAARIARAIAPRARIVGVEIDPEVVRVARRHFGLDTLGVEIVQADARGFLERSRPAFDLVLDDVFVGRGAAVRKPEWLPQPGLELAARCLRPGGVLGTNALDEAPEAARALRRLFPAAVCVRVAGYDNRILVGGAPGLTAAGLRTAIRNDPRLAATLPRLTVRSLRPRRARPLRRGLGRREPREPRSASRAGSS